MWTLNHIGHICHSGTTVHLMVMIIRNEFEHCSFPLLRHVPWHTHATIWTAAAGQHFKVSMKNIRPVICKRTISKICAHFTCPVEIFIFALASPQTLFGALVTELLLHVEESKWACHKPLIQHGHFRIMTPFHSSACHKANESY